jgi:hypothetical protein
MLRAGKGNIIFDQIHTDDGTNLQKTITTNTI